MQHIIDNTVQENEYNSSRKCSKSTYRVPLHFGFYLFARIFTAGNFLYVIRDISLVPKTSKNASVAVLSRLALLALKLLYNRVSSLRQYMIYTIPHSREEWGESPNICSELIIGPPRWGRYDEIIITHTLLTSQQTIVALFNA